MLGVFRGETASRQARLMHLKVKIPQFGRNKIFRHKQTANKVSLMLLDIKMLKEK